MPRYIDADEALRMMRNSKQDNPCNTPGKGIWKTAHDCCMSCVDSVSTADVVPKSKVVEEYRKKVYRKMEKYTVFGREHIQRIMRDVEKEMVGDKNA